MAIAQALGRDVFEVTRSQGIAAVKSLMDGVYAAFLTSLNTRNFCQLFPKVIKHVYDFAAVEATPLPGGSPAPASCAVRRPSASPSGGPTPRRPSSPFLSKTKVRAR